MYTLATTSSWFGARTLVAAALLVAALAAVASAQQQQDGCRVECYPNTKVINGKGGAGKGENCRWILRTDGKAARLCDHIKCRKVCPSSQTAASSSQLQEAASSSDNTRIEQRLIEANEQPAAAPATQSAGAGESMGIMRQLHGNKLSKAPVPGVAGGRLSASSVQSAQQQQQAPSGGRRMAPTLPPSVQYDENDTPPPISRFLDISPEE